MRLPAEFDLHGLEVFVLTVELGGMTACAQQLRITQSAVSQTITRLEQGIGAPLFDRSLRPLGLTLGPRPARTRASCWPMRAPPMTKCAKGRSSRSTS
ncbi:LysR family transcriptional regulator [Novosphingobium pokkalii]|uniref:helix-turn-helix domain-containing protein n=1 Tax=Novosphingobium pokkalii TaxID=1770194 RepID=UPI003626DD6F